MSSRMPPRYLPTLTEVVHPRVADSSSAMPPLAVEPTLEPLPLPPVADLPEPASDLTAPAAVWQAAPPEPVLEPELAPPAFSHAPATAVPDRHALAQQLIKLVQPQLEAELRSIAQELFEAQFSALLPSLQLHIEEAVREALDQALPEQHVRKD